MQYKQFKLKDLLEIKNGMSYHNIAKGDIPVYGSGGYMTSINKWLYDNESILLPRKGTLNNIMFVHGKFWTVDTMYWSIIDKQKAIPYYLFNYLKVLKFDNLYTGSTLPSMTNSAYYSIQVNLPSLEHQKILAHALKIIDKKIELNNKISSKLENIAKTLYNYWFVQFDFPDEFGRPYKSSGGKMVYNEVLKREIPVGWGVKAVKDLFKTYLGGTPSRNIYRYWNNGNISWLNSGEIANFPIVTSAECITQEGLENSATYLLPKNTVMISITGNIRVSISAINACTNQSVVGIMRNSDFSNSYLYFYFKNYVPQFEALMTGAVQKHINKDIIDETPFLLPKASVLHLYQQRIDPIVEEIINNALENKTLQQLRDFLLPMLMNGQVSVKD